MHHIPGFVDKISVNNFQCWLHKYAIRISSFSSEIGEINIEAGFAKPVSLSINRSCVVFFGKLFLAADFEMPCLWIIGHCFFTALKGTHSIDCEISEIILSWTIHGLFEVWDVFFTLYASFETNFKCSVTLKLVKMPHLQFTLQSHTVSFFSFS